MSTPRKDTIPIQDKNILGLQKYQCLPSHVPPFSSGFKLLRNKANDNNTETIDTSCTDKYDTSRTDKDDSIENVKAMKKTNDDEKIPTMMTNTKMILCNIEMVMKVLIILKLQILQSNQKKHLLNG